MTLHAFRVKNSSRSPGRCPTALARLGLGAQRAGPSARTVWRTPRYRVRDLLGRDAVSTSSVVSVLAVGPPRSSAFTARRAGRGPAPAAKLRPRRERPPAPPPRPGSAAPDFGFRACAGFRRPGRVRAVPAGGQVLPADCRRAGPPGVAAASAQPEGRGGPVRPGCPPRIARPCRFGGESLPGWPSL